MNMWCEFDWNSQHNFNPIRSFLQFCRNCICHMCLGLLEHLTYTGTILSCLIISQCCFGFLSDPGQRCPPEEVQQAVLHPSTEGQGAWRVNSFPSPHSSWPGDHSGPETNGAEKGLCSLRLQEATWPSQGTASGNGFKLYITSSLWMIWYGGSSKESSRIGSGITQHNVTEIREEISIKGECECWNSI